MSDIKALKLALSRVLPQLASQWFPGGRRDGHRYWPRSSKPGKVDGSMCIDIDGPYAGRWIDFADPDMKGDAIDLIAYAEFGMVPPDGRKEAIKWARDYLNMKQDAAPSRRPAASSAPDPSLGDADEMRRRDELARKAAGWWLHAQPLSGTHGEAYLRARDIDIARLRRHPGAIRFHPEMTYRGPDCVNGRKLPGLLTCMTNEIGKIRAVHRTFLDPVKPRKADVARAKMMWGDVRGCSIRLTRGVTGLTPEEYKRRIDAGKMIADDTLDIIEGIEDGLTWALIEPDARVSAAGSLSLLAGAPLFDCARAIRVIGDNDENEKTRAALEAAAEAIKERAGARHVDLLRPTAGKDINAVWLELRGAA